MRHLNTNTSLNVDHYQSPIQVHNGTYVHVLFMLKIIMKKMLNVNKFNNSHNNHHRMLKNRNYSFVSMIISMKQQLIHYVDRIRLIIFEKMDHVLEFVTYEYLEKRFESKRKQPTNIKVLCTLIYHIHYDIGISCKFSIEKHVKVVHLALHCLMLSSMIPIKQLFLH